MRGDEGEGAFTERASAQASRTTKAVDGRHRHADPVTEPKSSAGKTDVVHAASQPMTATTSSTSFSDHSVHDLSVTIAATASPYGTRSRNRTGGTRPNYAEDRDVEMDFDVNGVVDRPAQKPKGRPPTDKTLAMTQPVDRGLSGVSTRRASAALDHGTHAGQTSTAQSSSTKGLLPGMSTFSANPRTGSPPPKKRKVAAAAAAEKVSTSQISNADPPGGAQPTTRKASAALAPVSHIRDSNMLTFEKCQGYLKHGKLRADDGTIFRVNDHVYLVCEPPGEPYYLARIMEFLHMDNQPTLPIDSIRVNWYYRPRDINRKVTDTRIVFATMHSDMCPLTSLRGKCWIQHRSEIEDIDEYRKTRDCFWYDRLFDRYIHRYYDVIPVRQVINVPVHVKKVLDERWKFLVVEAGRGKELTSAVKTCKRCAGFCASNDSVECAVCHSTYHMNCVRPPLLKKPSRGFAWACGPCSRAQERKLEARNTPLMHESTMDLEEEEVLEEDEEDGLGRGVDGANRESSERQDAVHAATPEQSAHAKLWPYRYLGQHCRVEDALDYDDRIYPRASSRLGPRHQAIVTAWPGRPVEFVKGADVRRKYARGPYSKMGAKSYKDNVANSEVEKIPKEKRPKWVLDEPPGYVHRGEDDEGTVTTIFKMPEATETISSANPGGSTESFNSSISNQEEREKLLDDYISRAKGLANEIGVKTVSTNLLDKALEVLARNNFDVKASLKALKSLDKRKDLKEPELNKEEQRRFEEGVSRYGSELHSVTKHVRTVKHADIVRHYYVWKKSNRGCQIWGNYEGRRGKKEAKRADGSKLVDDVADDNDDSAFDEEKAVRRKKGFECKFCGSRSSRQWRRAPGTAPGTTIAIEGSAKGTHKDKGNQFLVALCRRCAELWRRYGIQWEDIDEVAKKVAQGGGKAWKRKIDEELLKEFVSTNFPPAAALNSSTGVTTVSVGASSAPSLPKASVQEPPKRKSKVSPDKELAAPTSRASPSTGTVSETQTQKKKPSEKAPPSVPVPEVPKPKLMPCAICDILEPLGDQHVSCRECRLTVHRNCYGIVGELRNAMKWVCDTCANDKTPQVSTTYQCILCPVRYTEHDFVEPSKTVHKKNSHKDREKERADRESAVAAAEFYRQKQEYMNRPTNPREALKRTAGNNWVHVTCAVWTPETKFGNAKALEPSEGIGVIPFSRYEQICKICGIRQGACVPCHQCHAPVHVACAHNAGYTLGFDITPVKGSRRDLVSTVTLGSESGSMSAAIWCKDHTVKTIVHPIYEMAEDPALNALQLYVRTYKQADLTLTGTVRKANLVNQSTKVLAQNVNATGGNRRASTSTGINGTSPVATHHVGLRNGIKSEDGDQVGEPLANEHPTAPSSEKSCLTCHTTLSPKWWEGKVVLLAGTPRFLVQVDGLPCTCPVGARPEQVSSSKELSALDSGQRCTGCSQRFTRYTHALKHKPADGPHGLLIFLHEPDSVTQAAWDLSGQSRRIIETFFQCHRCHWKTAHDPESFPLKMLTSQYAPPATTTPSQASAHADLPPASERPPPDPGHNWISHPQTPHRSRPVMADARSTHPPSTISHPHHQMAIGQSNGVISAPVRSEVHHDQERPRLAPPPLLNGNPRMSVTHVSTQAHQPLNALTPSNVTPLLSPITTVEGLYPRPVHIPPPPPLHHLPSIGSLRQSPPMAREPPSTPRSSAAALSNGGLRPDSEVRPAGGASASPSLRNLLS